MFHKHGRRIVVVVSAGLVLAACGTQLPQSATIPTLSQTQIVARAEPGVVQILGKENGVPVAGTGFVIDQQRHLIVTNAHVVSGATSLRARTRSGVRFPVRVYADMPCEDLAVVQAVGAIPSGLKALPLGHSRHLQAGASVTAIGFPANVQRIGRTSMASTQGTISTPSIRNASLGRSLPTYNALTQLSMTINPGNSGGPLVDDRGTVIGITTLRNAGSLDQPIQGQGYAISIDRVRELLSQLRAGHSAGDLGLDMTAYRDLDLAQVFGLDPDFQSAPLGRLVEAWGRRIGLDGVYVNDVRDGSRAARAHIPYGSVIQFIGGSPIHSVSDVCDAILSRSPGDTVGVMGRWLNTGTRLDQIGDRFYVSLRIP